MKLTNRIAIIGVLTALNVASRVFLQFLPNIKPVTSIIILSAVVFGLSFAFELAAATVLISGVLLGFGPFLPFQFLAWSLIAVFAWLLDRVLPAGRRFKLPALAVWAFLSGYVYGFFVSLDKLAVGYTYFLSYYVSGLYFDTLHAVGNLVFFPLCYRALLPVFRRYAANNSLVPQK